MPYPDSENITVLPIVAIILSFIIASSLNIYPLSPSMAVFRPMVMMMVLVFWLLFQPRYVGVFTAFTIGLMADLLMDTHLGQQAFAAVMVAFTIKIIVTYVKQLSAVSAWMIAGLSLLVFQLSLWVLQMFVENIFVAQSALSLMVSIISWPLVLLVLRRFTRR